MQAALPTLLVCTPVLLILAAIYRISIFHRLRSLQNDLVLNQATNDLRIVDIFLVIGLLVVEHLKKVIGLGPRRPRRRHGSATQKKGVPYEPDAFEFPHMSVTMDLNVPPKDIRQYSLAVGITKNHNRLRPTVEAEQISENNAHLALFLSAISGPALLLLLARPICPVNPLGAVNVRNFIRIINPTLCRQVVQDMLISTTKAKQEDLQRERLTVRASPRSIARAVKRGMEVDIRVVVVLHRRNPEAAEEEVEIFEQVFTVLEFGNSKSSVGDDIRMAKPRSSHTKKTATSSLIDVPKRELRDAPQLASYFKIKTKDPLQWARLGKDYNPIHISSLAAKLFGFRSRIAHGNHVMAKAIQILSQVCDEDFRRYCSQQGDQKLWMQIEFKRPVLLPAEVGVRTIHKEVDVGRGYHSVAALEVFSGDKTHAEAVVGTFSD